MTGDPVAGVYILTEDVANPETVDLRRGGGAGKHAGRSWRYAPSLRKGTTVLVGTDPLLELDGCRKLFLRPAGRPHEMVGESRPWFQAVWPHLKPAEDPDLGQVLEVLHISSAELVTRLLQTGAVTLPQIWSLVGWKAPGIRKGQETAGDSKAYRKRR